MSSRAANKIVIIGCGNVAWHLAKRLSYFRTYKLFVYNHRDNPLLQDFRSELKCNTEASLKRIIPDADVYFICVADKYISAVSSKIKCDIQYGAVVIHTSGGMKLSAIKTNCANTGVFYPLQTFSKKDAVIWKEVPIVTEASNQLAKKRINTLARLFTKKTIALDFSQRLKLHLAAVLVNNFTNSLYVAASDLLHAEGHRKEYFNLLLPLIRQTTRKLERLTPLEAQTGPAKRKDTSVQLRHLKVLSEHPELRKIYRDLSKLIMKQQQHNHA